VTELEQLISARNRLLEEHTPFPWKVDGDEVFYEEGGATIFMPADPYPRGDNNPRGNAEMVAVLANAVPGMLWILHCGIESAVKRPQSQRDTDTVGLALALAQAILDTTPPLTLELRAGLMERAQ
jgi:hypothetical protein